MKYIKLFEAQEYTKFKSGDIVYKKSELWKPRFSQAEFNTNADKYIIFSVVGILGRIINVQNLTSGEIEKNILTSKFVSKEEYEKTKEEAELQSNVNKYNL